MSITVQTTSAVTVCIVLRIVLSEDESLSEESLAAAIAVPLVIVIAILVIVVAVLGVRGFKSSKSSGQNTQHQITRYSFILVYIIMGGDSQVLKFSVFAKRIWNVFQSFDYTPKTWYPPIIVLFRVPKTKPDSHNDGISMPTSHVITIGLGEAGIQSHAENVQIHDCDTIFNTLFLYQFEHLD